MLQLLEPLHPPKIPVLKRKSCTVSAQKKPAASDFFSRWAPQTLERPMLQFLDRRMVYLREPTVEEQVLQENELEFVIAWNFSDMDSDYEGVHWGPKGHVLDKLKSLNGGTFEGLLLEVAECWSCAIAAAVNLGVTSTPYAWCTFMLDEVELREPTSEELDACYCNAFFVVRRFSYAIPDYVGIHWGPKDCVLEKLAGLNGGSLKGLLFETAASYSRAVVAATIDGVKPRVYAWCTWLFDVTSDESESP